MVLLLYTMVAKEVTSEILLDSQNLKICFYVSMATIVTVNSLPTGLQANVCLNRRSKIMLLDFLVTLKHPLQSY